MKLEIYPPSTSVSTYIGEIMVHRRQFGFDHVIAVDHIVLRASVLYRGLVASAMVVEVQL